MALEANIFWVVLPGFGGDLGAKMIILDSRAFQRQMAFK